MHWTAANVNLFLKNYNNSEDIVVDSKDAKTIVPGKIFNDVVYITESILG